MVEWLREIPVSWDVSKLRYMFSFGKGLTITKENLLDEGVPCVNYGEVHSKYSFELDPSVHPLKCVSENYLISSPNALLSMGDFVFADTSEDIDGSGNFTQLTTDKIVFSGYHTIIARPVDRQCSRFYAYLFDSREFRTQIRHAVKGVKVFSVTQAILRGIDIWLPTLDERTIIAAFLDHETAKIDTLIEKQQQFIQLLNEKRQAVISHAVTKGLNTSAKMRESGVLSIGLMPEHWTLKSLSLASKKLAVGLAMSVTDCYEEEGVPIIRNQNIKEGYFDGSDMLYLNPVFAEAQASKKVKAGDVVIVRTGSNVGLACCVPDEYDQCHTFTTLIVTPSDELAKEYFTYCMNSAYGKAEVNRLKFGFGKDNLNVGELRAMHALLPGVNEQKEIVSYLEQEVTKIELMVKKAHIAIELMQERRTALISAAVTGKIDVRDWVAPQTSQTNKEVAA
ncbi:restriction endonuclease subunit S [Pseudomonas fluorescens]|uniref:restriction endonuclease subunit S n=1 Tax=Pseudomonas fluorescens TaxID=294 RepID=UPI001CD68AA9|nr:restriction endonuclease subunit S [Pseudomonas fluorescens]